MATQKLNIILRGMKNFFILRDHKEVLKQLQRRGNIISEISAFCMGEGFNMCFSFCFTNVKSKQVDADAVGGHFYGEVYLNWGSVRP